MEPPRSKNFAGYEEAAAKNSENGDAPFGTEDDLSFPTISEILAWELDDKDLILPNGYLEKGALTTFCGAPSIGKSRLVAQLSICSILEMGFLGWETNAGGMSWMFLQSENSIRRLKGDIRKMTAAFTSKQIQLINEHLHLHCLIKDTDGYLNLADPEVIIRIKRAIRHFKPGVVVGDPLTGFSYEDLNLDKDMLNTARSFCRIVKEGDPKRAPLIIQHARPGRSGNADMLGGNRGNFARNSKALLGLTRAQINVAPYQENNNDELLVASGKCNNAKEFDAFKIELDKETMFYARCEDVDLDEWKERMGSNTGQFKQKLNRGMITKLMSRSAPRLREHIKMDAIDKRIMAEGSFNTYWKQLIEFTEIEQEGSGKWRLV